MKRFALLASFAILVGLSLFQTDALSQAESFRVGAERRSRQAEERGLAEAYKGITRDVRPRRAYSPSARPAFPRNPFASRRKNSWPP